MLFLRGVRLADRICGLENMPPPNKVNGLVVREAQQESTMVADLEQQLRICRDFAKHVLQQIASVGLAAHQVEQETEKRLCVLVVEMSKFARCHSRPALRLR